MLSFSAAFIVTDKKQKENKNHSPKKDTKK